VDGPIRLVEYVPTRAHLAPADLDYLLELVKGSVEESEGRVLESLMPTREEGIYVLRAGPFVGRLGLPSGRWIEFVSRFSFDDVVELIQASAVRPTRADLRAVRMSESEFIVDVIARAFVREVERLVARGLAKGYETHRFLDPPYPGRLDVAFHLGRLAGREDQLVTVARRLTLGVPVNRALALAIDVLRSVPLPVDVGLRVSRLVPAFRTVPRSPMAGSDVARIPLDRLTERYREALALAGLILSAARLAPAGNASSGSSVIFAMPRVWERSVLRWVREAWGAAYDTEEQFWFDVSAGGELRAAADVVVKSLSRVVALCDAKYKWPERAPTTGDVYQMVTYCERLGIDEATLVYPQFSEPRVLTVGSRRVRVIGIGSAPFETERAMTLLGPAGARRSGGMVDDGHAA
jgi:5-methylcytosine-specific restriction enzyme subunit McrC